MNALLTFLLSIAYLFAAAAAGIVFFGLGSLWPRHRIVAFGTITEISLRAALGMGCVGLYALMIGLAGLLYSAAILPVAVIGFVLGIVGLRRLPRPQSSLKAWTPLHKMMLLLVSLFAVNVLFGALSPDVAQDSLWYHLGCARAWAEWHRVTAPPLLFPASFPLHNSTMYAAVLLLGDGILCSLIYALQGAICYAIATGFAAAMFGPTAALWTLFLSAAGHGTIMWFVPINTGSDLTVSMFATGALLTTLHATFSADSNERPQDLLIVGGMLAGFGVVTKMTALGFVYGPCVLLWLFILARRPHLRRAAIIACAVSLVPMIVWGARNYWWGCGNPIFPVMRHQIPLHADYEHFRRLPDTFNAVWMPTPSGLAAAVANLPWKFYYANTAGSPIFVVHMLLAFAVFSRRAIWRATGVIVIAHCFVYLLVIGRNETIRYFAQVFPFGMVWAGALANWVHRDSPVSRGLRGVLASFLVVLFAFSYVQKQYRWGQFKSVSWPYRPILTQQDQLAYMETKENNMVNARLYQWVNQNTPRASILWFADHSHPFYVRRRYLWTDPDLLYIQWVNEHGVTDHSSAAEWLRTNDIDYVVADKSTIRKSPIWRDVLRQVSDTSTPAQLFEVRR